MWKLPKPALTLIVLLHFLKHHIYSKVLVIRAYLFSLDFLGNFLEMRSLFKEDLAKITDRGRRVKKSENMDVQILAQK